MLDDLFGPNGLGTSLVLHRTVFAHKHPIVELSAAGEKRLLRLEDFVFLVEQIWPSLPFFSLSVWVETF